MTKQKYFDYKLKLKIKKLASEKILSLIKTIQFDQWSKFTQEYKRKLNLKNLFCFSVMPKGLKNPECPVLL